MSDHYWLAECQLERIRPYFPRSHGKPRVDDRRVISGIKARELLKGNRGHELVSHRVSREVNNSRASGAKLIELLK